VSAGPGGEGVERGVQQEGGGQHDEEVSE